MSTKKTLIVIGIAIVITMGVLLRNTFFGHNREFRIVKVKGHDVCYMVNSKLTLKKTDDGFTYRSLNYGRANSKRTKINFGIVRKIEGEFTPKYSDLKIEGFKAKYFKEKNFRHFEYEIVPGLLLKEVFEYANQYTYKLSPYRGICDQLIKKHKFVFEI